MNSVERREITAVLLTVLKKIQAGMHVDVCELFWFTLGMMIDTKNTCIFWY